ncbi:MAG: 3-isopropylmalate dehydratase large subunit [Paludibacteraceae bacterium]|jgi:3-isopropylmalate/(R)-2-methylmalate dehydratase large subunit|nr:3-isopropylmalate dehydratase large subunit [Paludibacteraceae bacterium]
MNTLFDKIWDSHVVQNVQDGPTQLYIDRLYCHEVTSPQAFDTLRDKGIKAFRPDHVVAMPDHNTPSDQQKEISDPIGCKQVDTLSSNCAAFGIKHFAMGTKDNGIIHVVGPEKGLSLPGMTIVCGDSHTSTHGAVGAIAMGIGTSEVAQVLASQCILQSKPKTMRINIEGELQPGVTAKDVALYIMAQVTTSGATGYAVEYAGSAIRNMSMEGRLTLSNLSIEMGSRAGLIAPDEITFAYLKDREYAPKGTEWDAAVAKWRQLKSDDNAVFDKELTFKAEDIKPRITFGTNPGAGIAIDGTIPTYDGMNEADAAQLKAQLDYMQFKPGQKLEGIPVDYCFLGACTNGRIEDFRAFASVVKGKKKAPNVVAWLVPGSWLVRQQIIEEGIDKILKDAGFELRLPSCSSCLAMNPDKVPAGKLSISTSNRNFVGRQGPGARTILASPLTVAASAITGVVTDPRTLEISPIKAAEVTKVVASKPQDCPNCAFGATAGSQSADGAKSVHKAFNVVKSTCLPINIDNNNTDNIIPARYLAFTTRDPKFYGDAFMHDIRFDANNKPVADFVMNIAPFNETPAEGKREIIIGGRNWGSGSSREHAAWAIAGYGIRVVISSSFADIHRNNLLNCFVLPVIVSENFRQELLASIDKDANTIVTVDVPNQTVTNEATGHSEKFDINGYKKYCLLNGYDDIDYLLSNKDKIEAYEAKK